MNNNNQTTAYDAETIKYLGNTNKMILVEVKDADGETEMRVEVKVVDNDSPPTTTNKQIGNNNTNIQ